MKIKIDSYEKAGECIMSLPWGNGECQNDKAYAILNEADKIRCGRGSKVTTARRILAFEKDGIFGWLTDSVLNWLYNRRFH